MGEVLKSSTFSAGANDKLKWYASEDIDVECNFNQNVSFAGVYV